MKKVFKDRLLALADAIEHGLRAPATKRGIYDDRTSKNDVKIKRILFNMEAWGAFRDGFDSGSLVCFNNDECGTAACVGGHADLMFTKPGAGYGSLRLGLADEQRLALFYPPNLDDKRFYSRKRAARVIRNLVKTGKVDWRATA